MASTNLKIYPDVFMSLDGGLGWSRVSVDLHRFWQGLEKYSHIFILLNSENKYFYNVKVLGKNFHSMVNCQQSFVHRFKS